MKKRHAIIFTISVIVVIALTSTISFASSSLKLTLLTNKTTLSEKENVIINANISDLSDLGEGTNAYIFTLLFDSDKFLR